MPLLQKNYDPGFQQGNQLLASEIQGFYGFTGNYWYVKPSTGSDSNTGNSPSTAFATLGKALASATNNNQDVVFLIAESNTAANTTVYLSANLDWNKSVHLIGVNNGSFIGQRSRISTLSTVASFADLFTVSANNCLFSNLEWFQGAGSTTLSAAQTALKVTGQRNRFVNCQISGMGDLAGTMDYAGSNSLTITGSENLFQHCYIGLDTVIRATSVTEVVISGAARTVFEDCQFETYTSGSTFKMVSIATSCDRFIKFNNCDFHAVQNITSAVAPTGLLGITTMNGSVLIKAGYLYGFAQYVTADNTYVKLLSWDGTATSHLVGIAQSIDAA